MFIMLLLSAYFHHMYFFQNQFWSVNTFLGEIKKIIVLILNANLSHLSICEKKYIPASVCRFSSSTIKKIVEINSRFIRFYSEILSKQQKVACRKIQGSYIFFVKKIENLNKVLENIFGMCFYCVLKCIHAISSDFL